MGGGEMVLVFAAILVLFGAKKIPEFAKGLGQGIREFKKASREVTDEINNAANETPAPPPPARPQPAAAPAAEPNPPATVPKNLIPRGDHFSWQNAPRMTGPKRRKPKAAPLRPFSSISEDLRWVLIKSAAATLVAMTVCLFNVKPLVAVLKWPMARAAKRHIFFLPDTTNQLVTFQIGDNRFPAMDLGTNRVGALDLGTNQHTTVALDFVQLGGQQLVTWRVIPTPPRKRFPAARTWFS